MTTHHCGFRINGNSGGGTFPEPAGETVSVPTGCDTM